MKIRVLKLFGRERITHLKYEDQSSKMQEICKKLPYLGKTYLVYNYASRPPIFLESIYKCYVAKARMHEKEANSKKLFFIADGLVSISIYGESESVDRVLCFIMEVRH